MQGSSYYSFTQRSFKIDFIDLFNSFVFIVIDLYFLNDYYYFMIAVFDYRNFFGNFSCFEKFNSFKMHFNFELSKTIDDPNLKNFYYAHASP